MQERFHSASPGDFESTFIKAGDSKTKEGLKVEEVTGESLGGALLWLPRNVNRKGEPRQAAVSSLGSKNHSDRNELYWGCC